VFDEVQLRNISSDELATLRRQLTALGTRRRRGAAADERRRTIVLAAILVCCVALAVWTGLLAVSLPHFYRAGGWRGAWVGFDIALLAAFAATGWAAWRRRQVLIICLVVLATLLCCDAWFDVVLNSDTRGFELSLLSAVVIELPLALLAIAGARRLLRLTIAMIRRREGYSGPVPPFWRVPLLGVGSEGNLRDLFPRPGRSSAARTLAHRFLPQGRGAEPGGLALTRMRPASGRTFGLRWPFRPELGSEGAGDVRVTEGEACL
jgi:hypothetical protein